jgi:heterodisulfide reductase subunit A
VENERVEENFFDSPTDSNFGDVLIVGGGISGIQAALDLATTGYKWRPYGPA